METEEKDVRKYEISYLTREEASSRDIARLLGQHQIEVAAEGPLRRVNLAYKVNGETQAFFGFFNVKAAPAALAALERDLKTSQFVLRHLIVKLPDREEVRESGFAEHRTAPAPRPRIARPASAPRKSLSNVDLEKKLEEILK